MSASANGGGNGGNRRAFKVRMEGRCIGVSAHEAPGQEPGRCRLEITVEGRPGKMEVDCEERFEEPRPVAAQAPIAQAAQEAPVPAADSILAPMPGKVLEVFVSEGDRVNAGEAVIILEAMKMQNEIRAPKKGVIGKVHCASGESVSANDILMELR